MRGAVRAVVEREAEAGRHDADDGDAAPADLDLAPEDRRVAAEAALPEVVAEDDDARPVRAVLLLAEAAAERRGDAEDREDVAPDVSRADALRLSRAAGEHRRAVGEEADVGEGADPGPVRLPLVVGEPRLIEPLPRAPDDGDALRAPPGKRGQEDALHDAEERRRGADAEGEGEGGDDGEARAAAERAGGEAGVEPEVFQAAGAALVAHLLLVALDAAEGADGPAAGRVRGEAGALVVAGLHVEVEAHLLVELDLVGAAAGEGAGGGAQLVEPAHGHAPWKAKPSTRLTAPDERAHSATSASSCRCPSRVSS